MDAMLNFSPRAQQVLSLARKEAERLKHSFVGTEHVLLGLLCFGQGTAVAVLTRMGVKLDTVRAAVENQIGPGTGHKAPGAIPYTPRVKNVLSLAAKEARALNHTYVGTEHILLGLLREADGVAARVLFNLDVSLEKTRREVLKELDPNFSPTKQATAAEPERGESTVLEASLIDASKRYDVHCSSGQKEEVYTSVRFKRMRRLFIDAPDDPFSDFIELELADGRALFVARHSIIKFYEHVD